MSIDQDRRVRVRKNLTKLLSLDLDGDLTRGESLQTIALVSIALSLDGLLTEAQVANGKARPTPWR